MTSTDEMIEWIKTRSNENIETHLKENPAKADQLTEQGISYLMFSIYCRNKEAIELFKKHKSSFDIFEVSALGDMPPLLALVYENPKLVNAYSGDGFTPLGIACYFGNFQVSKYLIEKGPTSQLGQRVNL